jgi:predicted ATPase
VKLVELTIKNFKSLGDVTIKPSDLSVIIGPNGSGKTNLANAFAFLRDVYSIGLEGAVQRSGGFENIVSASNKQDTNQVTFELSINFSTSEIAGFLLRDVFLNKEGMPSIEGVVGIRHCFNIRSSQENNRSGYYVNYENLQLSLLNSDRDYSVVDRQNKEVEVSSSGIFDIVRSWFDSIENVLLTKILSQQQLLATEPLLQVVFEGLTNFLSNWSVYQLSPNTAKTPGVPTPNPTLSLYGNNLPVLVDHLIRKNNNIWQEILATMQRVVPTLTDITTGYLYNKTVGLLFHEEGFERPWNAEEVSDGTILALAMLCSVNDPRSTLVFIEEPENSLHPWILRELVNNFKHVAATKNIFITTHSPTLIDMFSPNDIWCISKSDRQTKLNRLTDIATELQADWEAGNYKLSDYLDSGLVPQAIPGGSI